MSNLSELLPAGAGAKSAEFVASGTLGSGVTVILQSDGTVEAVGETVISEAVGSSTVFETGRSSYQATVYDSSNNKIVVAYRDEGDSTGKAVVGTVSGSTISFGSPVTFRAADVQYVTAAFDSNANKVVISYRDNGNSTYGTAIVGTVSGTSISFGTAVVFLTAATQWPTITFDSTNNKIVIAYYYWTGSANQGTAIVGTVSGTSISFGAGVAMASSIPTQTGIIYDSTSKKIIVAYRDAGNSDYGTAIVGTVSGTSISFGSATVFESANVGYISLTHDYTSNKVVISYNDVANSSYGTAIVGTVSGTSISFGTAVVFESASTQYTSCVYFPQGNVNVIAYRDQGNSSYGTVITGTVSGTSISFGAPTVFKTIQSDYISMALDSTNNKMLIAYTNDATPSGESVVYQPAYTTTNSADFIGITDQAIADTDTGAVIVQGGVITNSSLNITPTISAGTSSQYDASVAHNGITYDTNSDKIVNTYRDDNNSFYGTAIVGTQSGTSFTYGTPVVFESVNSQYTRPVFDSGNNKVVVCYRDATNTRGRAVVGTVSGTSISFGTAATFDSNSPYLISAAYDSNAGKVVVAYSAISASEHGYAAVGTVSGTSISFGTPVVFEAAQTGEIATVYDSTNNKIVIGYNDDASGDNPTAIVGTVSGTSISFGSPVVIQSTDIADIGGTFDSTNGKVVFVYRDQTNSSYGTAAVGTVSGTSISFGTPVVYNEGTSLYNEAAFDVNTGAVVVSYRDDSNSNAGTVIAGIVSGTSITFGSETTYIASTANYISLVYNPDETNVVVSYQNPTGDIGYNVAVTPSTTMTTGSTYYVQDDGSLSTTSSSVTAGKALSSTTLLLKG
jgi:hypothetical protein